MTISPELLLGPVGLLVGCLLVIGSKLRGVWYTREEMERERARGDREERRADRNAAAAFKAHGAGSELMEIVKGDQHTYMVPEKPRGKR